MKILIVSWYFPPTNTMGALRVGKFAEILRENGHDVKVLTAKDTPHAKTLDLAFPEDRTTRTAWWDINAPPRSAARLRNFLRSLGSRSSGGAASSNSTAFGSATLAGMHGGGILRSMSNLYQRVTNWPDESVGWYWSAVSAGRAIIRSDRPDLIFASGPPFTTLAIGHALAREFQIPWIAEFRDRWWNDPYYAPGSVRIALRRAWERRWMKSVAGIVTVSEPWAEDYRERYDRPVVVAMNGYDLSDTDDVSPGASDTPKLRILYTGLIYPGRRDPSPLFRALSSMEGSDDISVEFYGCPENLVLPLAREAGVEHLITVHPPVSYRESLQLQRKADILLLMQWNDPAEQGNVPGKLFEYLAARRPILGIGYLEGVPATIVRAREAGLFSNDPATIASQLSDWSRTKKHEGCLPALPESTRAGFSRNEQYMAVNKLFEDAVSKTG